MSPVHTVTYVPQLALHRRRSGARAGDRSRLTRFSGAIQQHGPQLAPNPDVRGRRGTGGERAAHDAVQRDHCTAGRRTLRAYSASTPPSELRSICSDRRAMRPGRISGTSTRLSPGLAVTCSSCRPCVLRRLSGPWCRPGSWCRASCRCPTLCRPCSTSRDRSRSGRPRLAHALLAQALVLLVVLDARTVILGHPFLLQVCDDTRDYPRRLAPMRRFTASARSAAVSALDGSVDDEARSDDAQ